MQWQSNVLGKLIYHSVFNAFYVIVKTSPINRLQLYWRMSLAAMCSPVIAVTSPSLFLLRT